MTHPIPDAAHDDRLGFVGTAGSGKTYNSGSVVERVLDRKGRVIIPDPLGVWYGLRLLADGKTPSPYNVVIFGGSHGDLPINEHAGALIGETVARMAESAIIDLSGFGTKASERRFMLAFLAALYRHASGEPVHIVFDEADLWAPQKIMDKEGEAAKLYSTMETIVRRGRIKGFIPWLITQRPAVLSKDVLSQVDGLVAFKLTSSQDRDALGGWIEGQADRQQGKDILASLPAMQQGQGVIWIPGRDILKTANFPLKKTFDSSRTPKRGEKQRRVDLKPLDIGALKDRLATVEQEIKANDPKALKAEVTRLTRELQKANVGKSVAIQHDPKAIEDAEQRGYERGYAEGGAEEWKRGSSAIRAEVDVLASDATALSNRIVALSKAIDQISREQSRSTPPAYQPRPVAPAPIPKRQPAPHTNGTLSRPQYKVIEALVFWSALGFARPTRIQVGFVAGYSPSSGGFNNLLGQLKTAGVIDYPEPGRVTLTEHGLSIAPPAEGGTVEDRAMSVLSNPQRKLMAVLIEQRGEMSRDELGFASDYSPTSGGFNNLLGSLRSLGIIDYPRPGYVSPAEWLFA